jgi:hypothetical protein
MENMATSYLELLDDYSEHREIGKTCKMHANYVHVVLRDETTWLM